MSLARQLARLGCSLRVKAPRQVDGVLTHEWCGIRWTVRYSSRLRYQALRSLKVKPKAERYEPDELVLVRLDREDHCVAPNGVIAEWPEAEWPELD